MKGFEELGFEELGVTKREYGRLASGQLIHEYTLNNGRGSSLSVINYGGTVTSLRMPDRHGNCANVVLDLADLAAYVEHTASFACIVGRYANRIENGAFELDGKFHQLNRNNGQHTLHGGATGFGKVFWNITAEPQTSSESVSVVLGLQSPDGDQGFPGQLSLQVRYTLTTNHEWHIDYEAISDRATVLNLSSHCYFNLSGSGGDKESALAHELIINAKQYLSVTTEMIPESLESVVGTPFDFRRATIINVSHKSNHPQIAKASGYDHNFVLDGRDRISQTPNLTRAATLTDRKSGRVLEIETTEPGIQFYSGNHLGPHLQGPSGRGYQSGDGVCLETQHYPNSPNRADFPSTRLEPGQIFSSKTIHRFLVC